MPTLEELAAAEETAEETTEEEVAETEETEETEEAETTEESSEEGGEEATEEESDDPDAAFFEALAATGQDWRAKYGSREAAIQGMQHLMSRVGRKEAEEQIGQALLEKLGEEGVRKILYDQNGDDKADESEDELPASWNEMLAAQRILESDQASASEKEQARKQLTAFQRSVHETVQSRQAVLKEIDALKKQLAEFRQTSTETAEQAAIREWDALNGKDVYTADKKLTPLGQKVNDLLLNDEVIQQLPKEVDRRNVALRLARASQPKAKPHRKVRKEGKHQRSTGRQNDDLRTEEEQMKADLENMTEEEYLKAWVFRE
jgi:hypothetical protein